MRNIEKIKGCALFLLLAVFVWISPAVAVDEIEPNNDCISAQAVDLAVFPVNGVIESPYGGDVDYYRITAEPGTYLKSSLNGLASPSMWAFDSTCTAFLSANEFMVPTDGKIVLAIADGYLGGSYQLMLTPFTPPDPSTISGSVVMDDDGIPAANVVVTLRQCVDVECIWLGWEYYSTYTDEQGQYNMHDFKGLASESGTYRITVNHYEYRPFESDIFTLVDGQTLNMPIRLTPIPRVTAINGQVLDELFGSPLAGVSFNLCYQFDPYNWYCVNQESDGQGMYRFDKNSFGHESLPLPVVLYINADQYYSKEIQIDSAGSDGTNTTNIALKPLPVKFSIIDRECSLPTGGGECRYSVKVTNATEHPVFGAAWSIVDAWLGNGGYTEFQTSSPEKIRLASKGSHTFKFSFKVPEKVANDTIFCPKIYFGRDNADASNPVFDAMSFGNALCVIKGTNGAFSLFPEALTKKLGPHMRMQERLLIDEFKKNLK